MRKSTIIKTIFYVTIIIVYLASEGLFDGWFEETQLNPFDYARITDVDYKAIVVDEPNGQGKILVTERLTFDVHAARWGEPFWELWRDLPEEYIDGVKVDYKVNSVKQISASGTEKTYDETDTLYWDDYDYTSTWLGRGPGKWHHSKGPYNEDLRQYECVLFYVDGIYREEVVFEIEYEMYNAALRYADASELYITPYSESTIKYLNSFKGQILFPNNLMPQKGNYEAHTYGTNSNSFPLTESKTLNSGYHTFSFDLDKSQLKFKPYNQYIEFSLVSHGADKHIFTQHASRNDYYDDDVLSELREEQVKYDTAPKNFQIIKVIVLLSSIVVALLILIIVLNTDKRMKRRYTFFEPTTKFDYFRDIPSDLDPTFAATLVFCKHKSSNIIENGYSAVMLNLVRKGYIELAQISSSINWDFNNVKIIIKHPPIPSPDVFGPIPYTNPLPALTKTEEHYFQLIIRHAGGFDISMDAFQKKVAEDYEHTNSFIQLIKTVLNTIGISDGYFQKLNYQQPRKDVQSNAIFCVVMAALLIVGGNLISRLSRLDLAFGSFFILGGAFALRAIYLYQISRKYALLTQFGEDEYAKWYGLYNFFNSATLLSEREVIEVGLWEQYLVYATAFGIAEKVLAAIKIRCQEVDSSPVLRNSYYRSPRFYSTGRAFRSATRTASSTARSGGFGGHGGYGGGGRGGGGGGGGH